MTRRSRPRCPACNLPLYKVHVKKKYGPHFYCRKCKYIAIVQGGQHLHNAYTDLMKETGIGPDGQVLKPHQLSLLDPGN